MPTTLALNKLRRDLAAMGEMCEHAVASAIMALLDRDSDLACYVMEYDAEIDDMELAVDRDCVDLMQGGKLSGPNLRFVAAAAKINNDLERVGDLAVSVSEHVLFLVREKSILAGMIDFHDLLEQISCMMRESITALLERDTSLAWKIIDERKIVVEEAQVIFREVLDIMKLDPRTIERCCHILQILDCLHRVADQAANISEEVIFTEEGVVVRHHIREFHPVETSHGMREAEAEVIRSRKSREEVREEHTAARHKTRIISREEASAMTSNAKPSPDEVREKLLKLRAAKA